MDTKPKATRLAFGEALAELGEVNKNIVVLDADLSKSTKSDLFAKKFPERFFEMGIAEANMIGTAAGLALSGKIPFICSFGAFLTGRYDQIRMSIAYAKANVKLIGTHSGVGIGDDGHSQMGLEDISLMRGLPGMTVLQPCDEMETKQMIKWAVDYYGPVYIRLTRQNLNPVHTNDYNFQIGKLDFIKKGKGKIVLFTTGATVFEGLEALKNLNDEVDLINISSIKPINQKEILEALKNAKFALTVEDHYTIGGIGSLVSEVCATHGLGVKVIRLGIDEQFGESGDPKELYDKFGISSKKILERIQSL
jgi:transketolase